MAGNPPNLITNAPAASTGAATATDIHDIRPLIRIPTGSEWIWWLVGVLVVAVLAYLFYRWWRKKQTIIQAPTPPLPTDMRARMRLKEALEFLHDPKQFCIIVSDTIRIYLEERFSLHAPDRTTEEFLDELQNSAHLSFEQKQILGDFLSRCDLVKFAKYEPGPPELQGIYDAALRLVDETAPPPPASITPAGS
jgi:hypothetical protein